MKAQPTIIVKRARGGHKGHHGGAWKVAFADFMTALMAFFLVMWLVNTSPSVRSAVAQYFREPGAFENVNKSNGLLPGASSGLTDSEAAASQQIGAARGMLAMTARGGLEHAAKKLDQTARELKEKIDANPALAGLKGSTEIKMTGEGLRMELLETADSSFFEVGSSALTAEAIALLELTAKELGGLQQVVAIEGHTDSRAYGSSGYGNWELSTERANAARRVMERSGLQPRQITGVRGFADTRLRYPEAPLDARNRRISIVVQVADGESQ
jgi:chemotaxis protein MotB